MHTSHTHQPLTYDVRSPMRRRLTRSGCLMRAESGQSDIDHALAVPRRIRDERAGPAWKHVGKYIGSLSPMGIANGDARAKSSGGFCVSSGTQKGL